jgi:molybdopterin molybdotransferase
MTDTDTAGVGGRPDAAAGEHGGPGPGLRSVEEALAAVLEAVPGPLPPETVAVDGALGRVLAERASAATDLPPWDNSAMDGYAIVAADTVAASAGAPVGLRVVGEVAAGAAPSVEVRPGSGVRIATGAPIPPGADAVVPVELTMPVDAAGVAGAADRDATGPLPASILVAEPVASGASIRARADDLRAGDVLAEPGRRLTPGLIGLLAGAGIATVDVHRRPRVGVLATGDEVLPGGADLGAAGIPDANGPALRALVRSAGAEALDLGIAPDEQAAVERALEGALEAGADAIIVSGGVSVGPFDVVRLAFERVGRIDLWQVAVKPGKPFAFGAARAADDRDVLLFGLPGNPVSSAVTFEIFVRPAIRRLAGDRSVSRPLDRGVLADEVRGGGGRRTFLRVSADRATDGAPIRDDRGRVRVRLAGGQGSHVLTGLAAADALAVVPESIERLPAGSTVELWWLGPDA